MRKPYMLLVFGIWVAILPYLGFPSFWKNILFTLSGFGLIYFSYMLYRESKKSRKNQKETFDNFSENNFSGSGEKEM